MLLRTKIFRQLVLFALVPSLVIGIVAYYFLFAALDRASAWFSISAPDRTINSLRVAEARLQDEADALLRAGGVAKPLSDSRLDWRLTVREGQVLSCEIRDGWPTLTDSSLSESLKHTAAGPIREVVDGHLLLGWAGDQDGSRIAGGFILDREYLDGFAAATAGLSERRQFQNILPGLILFLVAAGGAVLVIILVVAYLLSRRLSRAITTPLEQLTAATAAVATGDYSQRITSGGTEEIVRLTETFNGMIADLEESRRRLIDSERVAAWQEFARRMAHELKNPLTPISLSLYRVRKALEESGHYERFKDSIEAIASQVSRLERLAGDYSSLAQIPAPKMKACDFAKLVDDLIYLYQPQLDGYGFELRLPSRPIHLMADPDHLNQVMVNLLKNAIEFTTPGGRITLRVDADNRRVVFALANESAEVDEESLRSAKMPYYSTRQGGSGLGLAVSEKIIVDHGGSLTLYRQEGMTVARFEIPVEPPTGGEE